jgi:hypothetical protein
MNNIICDIQLEHATPIILFLDKDGMDMFLDENGRNMGNLMYGEKKWHAKIREIKRKYKMYIKRDYYYIKYDTPKILDDYGGKVHFPIYGWAVCYSDITSLII